MNVWCWLPLSAVNWKSLQLIGGRLRATCWWLLLLVWPVTFFCRLQDVVTSFQQSSMQVFSWMPSCFWCMHLIETVYMLGLGAACAIMFNNYIIMFDCCICCKSGPMCSIIRRHDSRLNAPASKGGNASAARLPQRMPSESEYEWPCLV